MSESNRIAEVNESDVSTPASQKFAYLILGPQFIGWMLQIFFSGICFHSATHILTSANVLSRKMKIILVITMILLFMSLVTTVADLLLWGSTQKRSQNDLW